MSTITDGCVHPDVINLCQELPWKKRYIVSNSHLICSSCSLRPAPPLLPPLAMNHLAFGSLPSHLSSTVVWGQQRPVSRSQSVFHAEMRSTAQLGRLAPVSTQLFPASSRPRFSQKASASACVSLPLSLLVTLQGRDFSNTQERSQNFQLGFSRCVLCPLQSDLSVFQVTVTVDFHPWTGQWRQMSCGCPWIGEMALGSLGFFASKKHSGEI